MQRVNVPRSSPAPQTQKAFPTSSAARPRPTTTARPTPENWNSSSDGYDARSDRYVRTEDKDSC
jgi:hypothetical protein